MKEAVKSYGEFGPVYYQFKNKPKEAILFLKKNKNGECAKALFRKEIGYVDIVWGQNDPKTNRGFGLKHIIEKHRKEFKRFGIPVEDFIPFVFMMGIITKKDDDFKILIDNGNERVVLTTKWDGKHKKLLLSAYFVKKKPKK
ncbi:hypothetical protein FACS1894153_0530 [Bacteroidia bacterium]|nr:hypothetical protein FACS1894153_0530 [Bacteroidia bacterium]